MPNPEYTPGEWVSINQTVYALNEDGTNRFTANVQAGHVRQPRRRNDQGVRTSDDEVIANAQLMSAAPDLFRALLKSQNACTPSLFEKAREMANAAISKALGYENVKEYLDDLFEEDMNREEDEK